MQQNISLGQKIKNFRKRAGLSQLQLETELSLAAGHMSRLEGDKTNPTKETLIKICEILQLSPEESAELFSLQILSVEDLILKLNTLDLGENLDSSLQSIVDILYQLFPGYNGGVLFLPRDNSPGFVYSQTVSTMPNIQAIHQLLPKKLTEYAIDIEDKQNLVAKAISENKSFESYDLRGFGKNVIGDTIINATAKILGFGVGVVFPLNYGEKVIGAVLYTKAKGLHFSKYDHKILSLLSQQLAMFIYNSKQINSVKAELATLKAQVDNN